MKYPLPPNRGSHGSHPGLSTNPKRAAETGLHPRLIVGASREAASIASMISAR